jgi:arabinofuranosyltransferase
MNHPSVADQQKLAIRLDVKDFCIAFALIIFTILFVKFHLSPQPRPMEDASMLLRYSQNLARGHGIVWNVGEHPVEGATDFLYMLTIGLLSRLSGATVQSVAEILLFNSQVLSVIVMYLGLRYLYRAPLLIATGFAAILGAGIGYHFIVTEFSAPFYALFALLAWCMGTACVLDGVTWSRAIWFAIFGFITGLIRPDGVILATLMLASTMYGARRRLWPLAISFGTIFAVFGGIYFAWRLHYFGYAFPIPFYAKHHGTLDLPTAKLSAKNLIEMLLPLLPLAGLGVVDRKRIRLLSMWLITIAPFTAVWMLISMDNNHFARFQYVMVPLSMLTLGGLASEAWKKLNEDCPTQAKAVERPLVAVLLTLFAFTIFYNMHLYRVPFSNVGALELAERLRPYATKNYTMAVTEAGDLPLYSEWKAIDEGGFNDVFIARNKGLVTEEYLDRYKPEIIMYRVMGIYHSVNEVRAQILGVVPPEGTNDRLTLNDITMREYAVKHGYLQAAIWGGQYCDYHVFWVKPDMEDTNAIVSAIRDYPYYMQETGQLSYDFRDAPVPSIPCVIQQ